MNVGSLAAGAGGQCAPRLQLGASGWPLNLTVRRQTDPWNHQIRLRRGYVSVAGSFSAASSDSWWFSDFWPGTVTTFSQAVCLAVCCVRSRR